MNAENTGEAAGQSDALAYLPRDDGVLVKIEETVSAANVIDSPEDEEMQKISDLLVSHGIDRKTSVSISRALFDSWSQRDLVLAKSIQALAAGPDSLEIQEVQKQAVIQFIEEMKQMARRGGELTIRSLGDEFLFWTWHAGLLDEANKSGKHILQVLGRSKKWGQYRISIRRDKQGVPPPGARGGSHRLKNSKELRRLWVERKSRNPKPKKSKRPGPGRPSILEDAQILSLFVPGWNRTADLVSRAAGAKISERTLKRRLDELAESGGLLHRWGKWSVSKNEAPADLRLEAGP